VIKKIPIAELVPGMYIHDVNCSWRVAPIFSFRQKVPDDRRVEEIRELGVREVYIDTVLGDDLPGAPTEDDVRRELEEEMRRIGDCGEIAVHHRLASRRELDEALVIHNSAAELIEGMMADVRLGRQLEFAAVSEALHSVTSSVLDSFGTLIQLGQLKNSDDYTFQHSVGVCALLTAFGKAFELSRQTVFDIGIGALLHDIGKMKVPTEILNKPGQLTEAEFAEIKRHVAHGREVVDDAPWVSATALAVIDHHHERYDGTGYPAGLKGAEISPVGQMAAIVDVYDALTAERVYHKAMTPAAALRKLQEWSRFHFNEDLVAHFIRNLGIYPLRTVVRLESGLVGVVIDQNPADLLRPVLVVVADAGERRSPRPRRLDLQKTAADRIVACETPEKYGIDVDRLVRDSALQGEAATAWRS
jgi:HD-GYP domain-containing protein (c-di-GMP phosphodiesterase class II)